MQQAQEMLPITNMTGQLMERSAMYIEFLAAAFIQETGLKASETELVMEMYYDMDKVTATWHMRKRQP